LADGVARCSSSPAWPSAGRQGQDETGAPLCIALAFGLKSCSAPLDNHFAQRTRLCAQALAACTGPFLRYGYFPLYLYYHGSAVDACETPLVLARRDVAAVVRNAIRLLSPRCPVGGQFRSPWFSAGGFLRAWLFPSFLDRGCWRITVLPCSMAGTALVSPA